MKLVAVRPIVVIDNASGTVRQTVTVHLWKRRQINCSSSQVCYLVVITHCNVAYASGAIKSESHWQ